MQMPSLPSLPSSTGARGRNAWIATMLSTSESLAIVQRYFQDAPPNAVTNVPKKLTKGVYAGGFFNTILGADTEFLITIRNPLASCISTYQNSCGLPNDGKLRTRSTSEKWIKRDLMHVGFSTNEIDDM